MAEMGILAVSFSMLNRLLYLSPLLLVGCGQNATEQPLASKQTASPPRTVPLADSIKSVSTYTSGDRVITGPNDTLHVANSVFRLMPGRKSDFTTLPRSQPQFSEAHTILQYGDGRVKRAGHTLIVRPFAGPALRFSDDTYLIRKDDKEETDTHCQFLGSVPGRPFWLLDSLQWERSQPFLINKYSGRATLLSWEPCISPNSRQLFIATPGLDIESTQNGLELRSISDYEVKLLWTRTLRNWQPNQARWLDDHTIAIEQLRFEPKEHTTYVRLIIPN